MIISLLLAAQLPSSPSLGVAEGRCRANEPGPAILVEVAGLKDRQGLLKLEAYPSNDRDFLADDNVLVMARKVFRRVTGPVPARGGVQICIRIPAPGAYSLSLLHDRDSNRKFGLSVDGVGFPNNPRLGLSRPRAAATRVVAGPGITRIRIVMNYRRGTFFFGPLKR
ncbi:DUF2141 domain-containing protein [Allosphingosinicella deserti]|uniref:DUF2141 domain-containing protein n=1 Tax=Allosphingosinicella deserti TaxID=2116704 RepID=A0A2P7QYT4_9SPHN|nr:DUF2141 domain-containing protein [Sphingomonas deserti]PSJ43132.1 hypothetical protein C7I55_01730 [Sphingomonas deserti]